VLITGVSLEINEASGSQLKNKTNKQTAHKKLNQFGASQEHDFSMFN
jgi:hypothetical protein